MGCLAWGHRSGDPVGSEVAKNPGWGGNQKPVPGGKEPFQERPLSQLWCSRVKGNVQAGFGDAGIMLPLQSLPPAGRPAESRDDSPRL